MTSKSISACTLLLALSLAPAAAAAAPAKTLSPRVYEGQPTPSRGSLQADDGTVPSAAARSTSVSALLGQKVSIPLLWASVTPRSPRSKDRATLVFTRAEVVDARRGLASWTKLGTYVPGTDDPINIGCLLFGCPGDEVTALPKGMQLWINAAASHRYYAECRIRISGAKGDVAIVSDGFNASFTVDHTGKNFARVGFVVDPEQAGWYGFSIGTENDWTTYGCSVDELD